MPIIPTTLRFGEGPAIQRPMLVDSGADLAALSLDLALQLGMRPWQLQFKQARMIDGASAPVCYAPEGLTMGFWGFPARELPALVYEQRARIRKPYEVLGRQSVFGPLTVLFEESRSGPRVVFIAPGDDPFRLPLPGMHAHGPLSGEGFASFPFWKEAPGAWGRPVLQVRLWGKRDRSRDVPMLMDTGAAITVLPSALAHELGLPLWRMPKGHAVRSDGSLHHASRGLGVTLHAQVHGLPPVDLPFMVMEDAGGTGRMIGKLACAGLLEQYRVVFHRQDGVDRVTFLDAELHPPS